MESGADHNIIQALFDVGWSAIENAYLHSMGWIEPMSMSIHMRSDAANLLEHAKFSTVDVLQAISIHPWVNTHRCTQSHRVQDTVLYVASFNTQCET